MSEALRDATDVVDRSRELDSNIYVVVDADPQKRNKLPNNDYFGNL